MNPYLRMACWKFPDIHRLSQSHLVKILTRLASGILLARRDACLEVKDLDIEVKQSLRVQPIESPTMFGEKFRDIVKKTNMG